MNRLNGVLTKMVLIVKVSGVVLAGRGWQGWEADEIGWGYDQNAKAICINLS